MRPRTIVWLVLIIASINLGLGIWMPDTSTRTTISSILLGVIVVLGIFYVIALRQSSK